MIVVDRRSKFMVGLFMTTGIIIALGTILWLGMSRFFEEGRSYATYFDQSVQGLSIDSPVKFRGVYIGRVEKIGVAPDSRLIMVLMKIDSKIILESDMVAQLKVVGITGSMFIEIDRAAPGDLEHSPALTFSSEYPAIASKPSEISRLFQSVDEVVKQFNSVNFNDVANDFSTTMQVITTTFERLNADKISAQALTVLDNLNKNLDNKRWDPIIADIDASSSALKLLLHDLDTAVNQVTMLAGRLTSVVEKNDATVHSSLQELQGTFQASSAFLANTTTMVDATGRDFHTLTMQLGSVVSQMDSASKNMVQVLDRLSQQPSLLLFGNAPEPRKVDDDPYPRQSGKKELQ